MKSIFLIAALIVFSSTTFASAGSASIYVALNVQEQGIVAPRTQLKYQKSVGGLSCVKINDIISGDNFRCSLTLSTLDAAAIYSALDIEEKILPSNRTELRYQKSVGNLSCVKTNNIFTGIFVDCSFAL